ncbi:MAG: hypothetical protein HQL90_14870 [Magnetococcales bacterium]|nr:hypothetical protein [Magnetococcales bacterium]
MRYTLVLIGLLILLPWGELQAREIYKNGPYTVRKTEEKICKLEISLHKQKEPVAILALFPSNEYYGEMVTERARIGLARKNMSIQFDREQPRKMVFLANSAEKDDRFRWQYLDNTQGLLKKVAQKRTMTVSFSNGKTPFKYVVSLKGSAKAVKALRRCR